MPYIVEGTSEKITIGFVKIYIEVEYLKKDIVWECDEGHPWVHLVCTRSSTGTT
jgi:hypothetical protein